MRGSIALALVLLMPVATATAGSAGARFAVGITLKTAGGGAADVCIGSTGSGTNSSSAQVRCTQNVFVDTQVRFMPDFRPNRDTLLPDYCRIEQAGMSHRLMARTVCRLDDGQRHAGMSDEGDDGWQLGDSLFAMDNETQADQQQARSRLQDDKGTLTALRIANGGAGFVEMLVSF